jgi:hypothetical protein
LKFAGKASSEEILAPTIALSLEQDWSNTAENTKAASLRLLQVLVSQGNFGRGERIRTSGLYVPNV